MRSLQSRTSLTSVAAFAASLVVWSYLSPSALAQERHHSKPGAAYVMFLDFNGFNKEEYEEGTECDGSPSHVFALNIPAFDLDGNPATFHQAENDAIFEIWERIAEDFIPFDVDVTTEEPPGFVPDIGVGIRIVIGGDNGDLGPFRTYDVRGVASARENTALIPQDYHGQRTARSIAQTASHEAGHLFAWWTGLFDFGLGMSHYTSAESIIKSGRTQIIGLHTDDFSAVKRDIWWSHDPLLLGVVLYDAACQPLPTPKQVYGRQEDIAILLAALGARRDDHRGDAAPPPGNPGGTPVAYPGEGTALVQSNGVLVIPPPLGEQGAGRGVIGMNTASYPRYCAPWGNDPSLCHYLGIPQAVAEDAAFLAIVEDKDFFRFRVTTSGQFQAHVYTINNNVLGETKANLDAQLELWRKQGGSWVMKRGSGNLQSSASLWAGISYTVPTGETGEYAIAVKSEGAYGDLGQYTLEVTGSIVAEVSNAITFDGSPDDPGSGIDGLDLAAENDHWIRLENKQEGMLSVLLRVRKSSGKSTVELGLYDNELQLLTSAQVRAKPEASTELLWPAVPAGAYLLRVTGQDTIVDLDLALQHLSKK